MTIPHSHIAPQNPNPAHQNSGTSPGQHGGSAAKTDMQYHYQLQ